MQQWRERLNTIAAIAGDVGLFGCVLYFIVLKNFAQHVEVRFGVLFTGLCLLYFFNGQLLRRGISLRTYVACDLAVGLLLCGAGVFMFEMDTPGITVPPGAAPGSTVIYVPMSLVDAYKTADVWSYYAENIFGV